MRQQSYRQVHLSGRIRKVLCRPGRGLLQQFVYKRLIGLPLLVGHFSELAQQPGRKADGNELLRHAAGGPSDPPHPFQVLIGGFRDIGKINLGIGHMPDALSGSPALR